MLGLSYYDKSINGIKTLTDGKVIIQNGNITNVSDIQGSSATFDNLNSQEIQQLIYDVSLNQTNIEINTQNIQTNTLSISNLQTSVDNDVSILEGQIEQNGLNILDNENAIIQIQAIQSQPLNRLIDQSNNVVGENILMPTQFLGNISVNGDISGNTIKTSNILLNGTINQQANLNYNFLSKTEVTDLIITNTLELPSNVEIGGSVHTDDMFIQNAKIIQTNTDPNNINILTGTDFNGSVEISNNLDVLSTSNLTNLNVSGISNLGVINSQTITSINNNISTNQNDITTLNNSVVDISNNITILYNDKANILNPTFTNDVSILNLLTCRVNPLLTIDNGTELSDNNYLCTHKTARDIAQYVVANDNHNNINSTSISCNSLTTTNIDITSLGLSNNILNFKWYNENDLTSDLIANGATPTIGDYKTLLGASEIATFEISSGDNEGQALYLTSGGLFENKHTSIQAYDTFRSITNTLKIQPLGGVTEFGGNITSPTITNINNQISSLENELTDLSSNFYDLSSNFYDLTPHANSSVHYEEIFTANANTNYYRTFTEISRNPIKYRLYVLLDPDEEPAGTLNGVREWVDVTNQNDCVIFYQDEFNFIRGGHHLMWKGVNDVNKPHSYNGFNLRFGNRVCSYFKGNFSTDGSTLLSQNSISRPTTATMKIVVY